MAVIDRQARVIEDSWITADAEAAPASHRIIPLSALPAAGAEFPRPLGVLLPPDAVAETLADRLGQLDLIAISFPKFRDGRGFTLARTLREKYGFKGDIRAAGHVIPDQFAALVSCGFSTIETSAEHPPAQWRAIPVGSPGQPVQFLNRLVGRGQGK